MVGPPLPGDPLFPQLGIIADSDAMKALFQRQLPGFADGQLQIEKLKITALLHTPGKRCRVSYAVRLRDTRDGGTGKQILQVEVTPKGGAEARYAEGVRDLHCDPPFGPAIYLLAELDMVVWGFPNGPVLKGLPRLWDRQLLADFLRAHWQDLGLPADVGPKDAYTQLVKHVPGDRCTFRHRVTLGNDHEYVLYSKSFSDRSEADRVFRTMQAIFNSPASRAGRISIPEPLFHDPEMGTVFTAAVEGDSVDNLLSSVDLKRTGADSGEFLASLHQCVSEGLPAKSADRTLSRLARARELLSGMDEDRESRVSQIVDELERQYPTLPPVPATPIHGAFRLSQLLMSHGKLTLLDFDDFTTGNPVRDVASFVAHLLYIPWKGKQSLDQSLLVIRSFCHSYAAQTPWGLPVDVLNWHTAANLVGKHARRCVQKDKENGPATVDKLLGLSEDILAHRLSLTGKTVLPP